MIHLITAIPKYAKYCAKLQIGPYGAGASLFWLLLFVAVVNCSVLMSVLVCRIASAAVKQLTSCRCILLSAFFAVSLFYVEVTTEKHSHHYYKGYVVCWYLGIDLVRGGTHASPCVSWVMMTVNWRLGSIHWFWLLVPWGVCESLEKFSFLLSDMLNQQTESM